MSIRLQTAAIVTCFDHPAVGTYIHFGKKHEFMFEVFQVIRNFDFAGQRIPGQGVIDCPGAIQYISAGVGRRTLDPNDYHPVLYRGNVELFLKREKAAPVEKCLVIVYTKEAYLNDPEVKTDETEFERIRRCDCTHVLVAVLGLAGPKAPLSPHRFVSNLAGGNNEVLQWTADEIRTKASEANSYWKEWCTVAD